MFNCPICYNILYAITLTTVQILLIGSLIIFIVFPIVFRYSITLQRGLLFLTFITYPKDLDLSRPVTVGLPGTRSFSLTVQDSDVQVEQKNGIRIGIWHVLPLYVAKRFSKQLKIDETFFDNSDDSEKSDTKIAEIEESAFEGLEKVLKPEFKEITAENEQLFYERTLKLPGVVFLYLHGNTASRGSGHRIDVYKLVRKLGFHILTIDYRGYGDSDKVPPTEEGVVRDAMAAYQYIRNITSNPIFIWGHSLGTGVSTSLCAQLNFMNEAGLRGLILESPFTNIREEIRQHPFAKPFRHLPWFDVAFVAPMYANSLRFESDQHISEFRQPVMILHAEDDNVVPFQLGYKLYRIALDTRGKAWGPVEFHRFDNSHHYGHKYICQAPELPNLIKDFVNNYRNERY